MDRDPESLEQRVEVAEACRDFEQLGHVATVNGPLPIIRERRRVVAFESWLSAEEDASQRGACIVFDVHFRFWSVPSELTLHQMHEQIVEHCLAQLIPLDLNPIPSPPTPRRVA